MRTAVCCKKLSIEGLLREARRVVATHPGSPNNDIALGDHLMAALTLFRLNYPPPLLFDHDREDATVRANLKALYGIERAPRDTRLHPVYMALFRPRQEAGGVGLPLWPLPDFPRRHRVLFLAHHPSATRGQSPFGTTPPRCRP
jgi:hypothetical protein